jgi:phytoene/squalene synthetase
MLQLYMDLSYKISRLITRSYSTSFSAAVSRLKPELRKAVFSIYGFVRFADEIVDTFHCYDKKNLLEKFENDYYDAMERGISLNPVLHSFCETVRLYRIPDDLIRAFLRSMKYDLTVNDYKSVTETNEYIYGSAEVVGLMCLRVLTGNDDKLYEELLTPAKKLGAAFQKVNFLRDLKNDTQVLRRRYFHHMAGREFNEAVKRKIISDISDDFNSSYPGIKKLPSDSKPGVLIAYYYFRRLLDKLKRTPAEKLLESRIRVPDIIKLFLLVKAYLACKLNLV